MAATNAVWGIDVGQCALKALRCKLDSDGQTLVADAFDFIEYPKILSQPEADPAGLVREAFEQFLSRNEVTGDRIAMSVAGQNGLARFFKPPPVDAKKIPDIVKYEARQQIPFELDDVIWDYQRLGGTADVDGFALDTEIGLFAMKREQVYKSLKPFTDVGIEVDVVQLGPLAVYNFLMHTLLADGPTPDEYDPADPPEMMVVLSLGTDTTDLIVTNGFKVWLRNIPIGGNHFTKQLTKDLKLTFAKAEHLKRNARQSEDAKTIFQSMRPVFNDLLTEVQRSIGYFQNIEREAKIRSMVVLGNPVKLPGLHQYLAKNLDYNVVNVDSVAWAAKMSGTGVLSSPKFKENMGAFGTCYGLCLQALGVSKLATNLLPKEIVTNRLIRAKKPWVVAAVGTMLLGCSFSYFFSYNTWNKVRPAYASAGLTWEQVQADAKRLSDRSNAWETEQSEQERKLERLVAIGREVSGNSDRRLLWLELMKAINDSLPRTPGLKPGEIPTLAEVPIVKRHELYIEYIESQHFANLSTWYETVKHIHAEEVAALNDEAAEAGADGVAAMPAAETARTGGAAADAAGDAAAGPHGPATVRELKGYHYHNDPNDPATYGGAHVRKSIMKSLREAVIELPAGPGEPPVGFTTEELGIGFVVLAYSSQVNMQNQIPNPEYEAAVAKIAAAAAIREGETPEGETPTEVAEQITVPQFISAPRHDFRIQFCWQENLLTERLAKKRREAEEEAERRAAEAAEGGEVPNKVAALEPTGE